VTTYFVLKYLHVIGAAVLLGTGSGIAFFMLMAHFTGDPRIIAGTARIVVIADFLFTATTVVAQPITGVLLVNELGYSMSDGWIVASIALYILIGFFWLPVVWIQMRLRDIATQSARDGTDLPRIYHRYFWTWFYFGFPAFGAMAVIFWLMIARPNVTLW
jgi:uncharacterized membrane protein